MEVYRVGKCLKGLDNNEITYSGVTPFLERAIAQFETIPLEFQAWVEHTVVRWERLSWPVQDEDLITPEAISAGTQRLIDGTVTVGQIRKDEDGHTILIEREEWGRYRVSYPPIEGATTLLSSQTIESLYPLIEGQR